MQPTSLWTTLPTEMKLSVVDLLDINDVKSFATANRESYSICVPAIFRTVNIASGEALRSYNVNVPQNYNHYIRQLDISTVCSDADASHHITDAVVQLLTRCTQVEHLTLNLAASLTKAVIPVFKDLQSLQVLCINHCGDEQNSVLSERLVVSIAASIPNLAQLSLDRISRSAMHAPELVGAYPFVPLVTGDADIPAHPLLRTNLSLPSLLRIPTLKKLRIRDTHLGDPQWTSTPVCCSLEVLDLGSCYHESPDFNRECTERIMGNVGPVVNEFALNTALSCETFEFAKRQETPLKKLRRVHLTPLFPVENVVNTLSNLSGSPVEQLSVQCHEDDVVDMCTALEDFLSLRAERGEKAFYEHLTEISVDTVRDLNESTSIFSFGQGPTSSSGLSGTLPSEHVEAVKRLKEFWRDLRLAGVGALSTSCANSTSAGATDGDGTPRSGARDSGSSKDL